MAFLVHFLSLLAAPGCVLSQVQLVQSGPGVVKLGETLALTCSITGDSVTSNYWEWVRQAPGKGLEWVGQIDWSSSNWRIYYGPSFQSRATLSADSSKNQFSLELRSLTAADSGTYYCAIKSREVSSDKDRVREFRNDSYRHLGGVSEHLNAYRDGARSQIVLTQSGPERKKPGESTRLKCAVSGFAISGDYMDWVRQEPGKGLEWLVGYWKPGQSEYYSPTIQGRFTASKDSSNFYL
ncbi:uncharacterized protein LOC123347481 [Mauremys mutica]|uniref:uncharacterized protein LOC123347481 n=1 Tax=Mauremys mutica TaxID=74926 RepID=UPI001D164D8D|nr:uncharacterized protein LOC123347481 [Mauremys mutica]